MAEFNLGFLNPGTTRTRVESVDVTLDAEDTYRFQVTTPGNVNLMLRGIAAGNDLDLTLYQDANLNGVLDGGDTFVASSSQGSNLEESINLNLAAATYIVQVNAFIGSSNYRLQLSNTGAAPSNLLPLETNVGTLGAAVRSYSNFVGSTDAADVYRFALGAASNFNLSLTGLSADADVRLIRDVNNNRVIDAGDELVTSQNDNNADEAINVRSLAAGTYFTQVYQFSGNANYTVRLSQSAISGPSNNLVTAEAGDFGTLTGPDSRSGAVGDNNTTDMYRFSLASAASVAISLTGLTEDADIRLIRDTNNNGSISTPEVLGVSNFFGTAAELINASLAAGTYYVQVYQFGGGTSTGYTLGIA